MYGIVYLLIERDIMTAEQIVEYMAYCELLERHLRKCRDRIKKRPDRDTQEHIRQYERRLTDAKQIVKLALK